MRYRYKTLEEIPEAIRSYYKQDADGSYVLNCEGAADGARLVVLPEYFNCLGDRRTMLAEAEASDGPTAEWLAALAREFAGERHEVDAGEPPAGIPLGQTQDQPAGAAPRVEDVEIAPACERAGDRLVHGLGPAVREAAAQAVVELVRIRVVEVGECDLVTAADAISGSRPGARREMFEGYVKRLKHGTIGRGLNNYDAIFSELRSVGFNGWISIEDGVDGMDQLARSVRGGRCGAR